MTLETISYLLLEMIMEKLHCTVILLLSKTQNISKEEDIPVMLLQSDGQKMIPEFFLSEEKINALWFGKYKKWEILKNP